MTPPDLDALEAVAKGATEGQVEFLVAVARFIEAEFVHAKAISDHMEARKGKKDLQDWGHSRDEVDLAHADLMNWPAITADMIAHSLQQQAVLLAYIRELAGERDKALSENKELDGMLSESAARTDLYRNAVSGITENYQSSEKHHPDDVLIPVSRFKAICDAMDCDSEWGPPKFEARLFTAESRIRELEGALEPFAKFGTNMPPAFLDDEQATNGSPLARKQVTFGDFRRARTALRTTGGA